MRIHNPKSGQKVGSGGPGHRVAPPKDQKAPKIPESAVMDTRPRQTPAFDGKASTVRKRGPEWSRGAGK